MESWPDESSCKIKQSDLEFPKNNEIGQGAFGKVKLAIVKGTGEKVAIKKVFQDRRYKNRELPIMLELHHPNIVENKTKFDNIIIKLYSFQMLKCIGYLHSLGICHRDIKPHNILIDPADYTLKLCDFGCAKHLVKTESNISYICSRFFRPPELVVGANFYTTQVDVWSMGCVIAELTLKRPIFAGKSASDQFLEIMKVLGTPTNEQMKIMSEKKKGNSKLPKINPKPWNEVFKGKINDPLYIDLVSKLLVYEPLKRLRPYEALNHPYFDELKQKDVKLPDNKNIPKHLFEFKQCEFDFDKESIDKLLSSIQK